MIKWVEEFNSEERVDLVNEVYEALNHAQSTDDWDEVAAVIYEWRETLEELLQGKAEVRFNGAITLADSEPEPDITIVRLPESRYDEHHPYPEDIYWLIEVANTSLKKDLELKKSIYAAANIPEY